MSKAVTLSLTIGLLGLIANLVPFGSALEKNYGLHLFFKLRGVRQVPPDVIIVSMDKTSASHLQLPGDLSKWPRSLHARLVDRLVEKNVAVIAFDVIFSESRDPQEDNLFAAAIRKADSVILCDWIKSFPDSLSDFKAVQEGYVSYEELVPPIPPLVQSAVASAPFALPKVPVKVNSYWAFKTGSGDTPTFPVVVFQFFALQVYNEFFELLKEVSPALVEKLPISREVVVAEKSVQKLIRTLRTHFEQTPRLSKKMMARVEALKTLSNNPQKKRILTSLIRFYQGPKSHYLNFYGPPGMIPTIPYHQILNGHGKNAGGFEQLDLKGRVVFVGLSERLRPGQKDGFYTVFTRPDGLDLSGVEIAATAFANLLEDMAVQPIGLSKKITLLFLWGMVVGALCILTPTIISASGIGGLGILYLFFAHYQFKHTGLWYPLVIPLFLQAPLAFFGAVLWKFFHVQKERQKIRQAFELHLPKPVVNQLSKNIAEIKTGSQEVYGICLTTDLEDYTALAETLDPKNLAILMNRYYETIFEPTKRHGGAVSDIIGDSMLALWVASPQETAFREKACSAALDIQKALEQFNQTSGTLNLNTRIGLNSGQILLGHIGAIDHYEYRPVGDIVNTAARIEGLNKQLGTQVLVSEEVIHQLDGFMTRDVGKFRLKGKVKPIVIHELLCRIEECDEQQKDTFAIFAEAMRAFRRQSWDEAIDLFDTSLKKRKADGPSNFYLQLCETYRADPPETNWDCTVILNEK
jgi:adenylate cyclase